MLFKAIKLKNSISGSAFTRVGLHLPFLIYHLRDACGFPYDKQSTYVSVDSQLLSVLVHAAAV